MDTEQDPTIATGITRPTLPPLPPHSADGKGYFTVTITCEERIITELDPSATIEDHEAEARRIAVKIIAGELRDYPDAMFYTVEVEELDEDERNDLGWSSDDLEDE